jgi:LytS/YehU family sensor histidine kinase
MDMGTQQVPPIGTGKLVVDAYFLLLELVPALSAITKNNSTGSACKRTVSERKSYTAATKNGIEMQALRAQMNPHFIFNSLNLSTVYSEKRQVAGF